MKDFKNRVAFGQSLAPAGNRSAGTANGTGVDLKGYDSALITFEVGTLTDGVHTPKLQESDDSTNGTDGTWNDVAASDQIGALGVLVASTPQIAGYIGAKRWVRAVVTTVGGATGAMFAASVTRGHARHSPVGATQTP